MCVLTENKPLTNYYSKEHCGEKQGSNDRVHCCSDSPAPLTAVGLTAGEAAFENATLLPAAGGGCLATTPGCAFITLPDCVLSWPLTSPPVLVVTISLIIAGIQRAGERMKS